MYAKMIRRLIYKYKDESKILYSRSVDRAIQTVLDTRCYKIRIRFKYNGDEKIETDKFGVDFGVKCPHDKTNKSLCSNCPNFVIHNFELKYGKTLIPYTSTCTAYCSKQKYRCT